MTLLTAARNAAADAITALLNNGSIIFETSGDNEVSINDFAATAFAAAVAGVATANAIADDSATIAGTIEHAVLRDSGDTPVINATVGETGSGLDFEMPSLAFGNGDTLQVNSLTLEILAV